jgi:hypothetical protein
VLGACVGKVFVLWIESEDLTWGVRNVRAVGGQSVRVSTLTTKKWDAVAVRWAHVWLTDTCLTFTPEGPGELHVSPRA